MRLNINLATQPYQDVRRILFRWGIALALLGISTGVLLWAAISATISWRNTSRQTNYYRAEIAKCDRKAEQAKALLDRPENRVTRDRSQFINALIAQKAFSWTEVLMVLENKDILPPGIHIVGIVPDINDDGQLELRMSAAGQSRERAVELIRNMEKSPAFQNVILRNDTTVESGADNAKQLSYRFDISAIYVPPYERKMQDTTAAAVAETKGGR
jgi:type IV pilus assembly protein PilN